MLRIRPFRAGSGDLEKMLALVRAAWSPQRRAEAMYHVGDVCWRLRDDDFEQSLCLWEDEQGQLAGFAAWRLIRA